MVVLLDKIGNKMKKLTIDEFIKRAKKIHGSKYNYDTVCYHGMHTKVHIVCLKHGVFFQTPHNHLKGRGCPKCSGEYLRNKFSKSRDSFVCEAKKIHGENYDYSEVNYVNAHTKVKIFCKESGQYFYQTPHAHLQGQGCPCCREKRIFRSRRQNGTFNTSKIQDELYLKLKEKFGEKDVKREYNDDERYPFFCDFYIKPLDLFIELNGIWTHGFHWFDENNEDDVKKLKGWMQKNTKFYRTAIEVWTERDVLKRKTARKNNLNYVVFWGDCRNDIDQWFEDDCPIRKDWK